MSASAVASPPKITWDDCVVLHNVSWETYDQLVAEDGERRVPRISYDRGILELVTPSLPHEKDALTITRIVDVVAALLGTPVLSAGATAYRQRAMQRGFEPDASFYVQNEPLMRESRQIDLAIDPPPDIVLEMEMSRSALDKLPLFANLSVPEVWRCDGERVTILALEVNAYREVLASRALPVLTADILTHFLALSRTELSPAWFRAVSEWAMAQQQNPDSSE